MFFYSADETRDLLRGIGLTVSDADKVKISLGYSEFMQIDLERWAGGDFSISTRIINAMGNFDWALIWITGWGIWPSREDWNLYYRLRRCWGNPRELNSGPGHKIFRHERGDLATLLSACIQNGWDAWLCPYPPNRLAFVSHDGWAVVSAATSAEFDAMETALGEGLVTTRARAS